MNILISSALAALAGAVVSCTGFLLVSRFVPERWLAADSDAAGALYSTIGMVYAILLALAALAVWEPRTAAAGSTVEEASALADASWAADSLATTDRDDVNLLIRQYLAEATGPEWRTLRDTHHPSREAEALFTRLRQRTDSVDTGTDRQSEAQQQLASYLGEAASARRARLNTADQGMPKLLWPILLGGGLVSVLFIYLFGLRPTFPNALMMLVVGAMMALLLFVIYQVEYPFSRAFAITPDPLLALLSQVT